LGGELSHFHLQKESEASKLLCSSHPISWQLSIVVICVTSGGFNGEVFLINLQQKGSNI
jgi:hypothetical protein